MPNLKKMEDLVSILETHRPSPRGPLIILYSLIGKNKNTSTKLNQECTIISDQLQQVILSTVKTLKPHLESPGNPPIQTILAQREAYTALSLLTKISHLLGTSLSNLTHILDSVSVMLQWEPHLVRNQRYKTPLILSRSPLLRLLLIRNKLLSEKAIITSIILNLSKLLPIIHSIKLSHPQVDPLNRLDSYALQLLPPMAPSDTQQATNQPVLKERSN